MKTCSKCEITQSLDSFSKRNSKKNTYQSWCKKCLRSHNRKTYQTKPDRRNQVKANTAKYRAEVEDFLFSFLSKNPCTHCGENRILALEFDHLFNKDFNIAESIYRGMSLARVKKEVNKCQVLCANCHRIKTALDIGNWKTRRLNK